MPRRIRKGAADQCSTSKASVLGPPSHEQRKDEVSEVVNLGMGSRSSLVKTENDPAPIFRLRGLLPVPPEVEAEVDRQVAKRPMTQGFRKALCDRLTLEHYFSNVDVAFRRTPQGIEVVAAGLAEIAEFRKTASRETRQGVVYGVG